MSDFTKEPVRVTLANMVGTLSRLAYKAEPEFAYEAVADEYGNTSCRYVHNDKASCIIGQALASMGVSLEDLSSVEGKRAEYALDKLANDGVIVLPHLDSEERSTLDLFVNSIQGKQDDGMTWKDAFIQSAAHLVY